MIDPLRSLEDELQVPRTLGVYRRLVAPVS